VGDVGATRADDVPEGDGGTNVIKDERITVDPSQLLKHFVDF
jgi:hypothetical protein